MFKIIRQLAGGPTTYSVDAGPGAPAMLMAAATAGGMSHLGSPAFPEPPGATIIPARRRRRTLPRQDRPMRRLLAPLAVASALFLTAVGSAQDPQSKVEPRSAPGAGQKYLERFVGDWDVAKAVFPRTGEPNRSKGTCRQAMIQGGRFLQSEFTFGEGDRKTTGLGLIGFEPESGLFTSVWIDSRQTRMSMRKGREKFDGAAIVLYSESLGEAKESRRSKTVSRLEEGDGRLVHRQFSLGPAGEERLFMELVMTRAPRRGD
jgi:hypothetical protein